MSGRHKTHGVPDPSRAHGAWIYLIASTGAGALVGSQRGVEPAMLVGTGFAGAFLVGAALSAGKRPRRRQVLLGTALALLAPLGALWMGADPVFLVVAASASLPALAAFLVARVRGPLSRAALMLGITTLGMAAPAAAVAGGASPARAALLLGLLVPVFCWRSLRIASDLERGGAEVRKQLRTRGLRESAVTALWSLAVALGLRIL